MSILKLFNKTEYGAREVVIDIETTGLFTKDGHRIVEIAVVEMRGGKATGRQFHNFINPQRDIPADAVKVHGISSDKVRQAPAFADIARHLHEFIDGDNVIIAARTKENYTITTAFLNMEMERAGLPPFNPSQWVNIRRWAELMFGEKSAALDKVLDKYAISRKDRSDSSERAILNARLVSELYPKLLRDYMNFCDQKALAAAKDQKIPPTP